MGYNTCIVLCNDDFQNIESDPEFGKRIVRAAAELICHPNSCVYVDNATVVSNQHADEYCYVKVGGNTGRIAHDLKSELEYVEDIISVYKTKDPVMRKRLLAIKTELRKLSESLE